MSRRRPGSLLHGPRSPTSRRSSSSSIDSISESIEDASPRSRSTSSASFPSSFLLLSDGYEEPIDSNTLGDAELKRRSHIRRPQRRKSHEPRPLPPIPRRTHKPSLSLDIPLSAQSRPRWLPVPPLPMTPFPTIPPTACSTPATTLPPPVEYPRFEEEIDWSIIDEIIASSNP